MSGQGGWPMTVFLDPDGVPFYGGTYFPPDESRGMPSFRMVMEAVVDAFERRREEIRERAAATKDAPRRDRPGRAQPGAARGRPARGGDRAPALERRPPARRLRHRAQVPARLGLELLLARGEREIVERTLDAMLAGGIYDQIGGGFARYSVDADWLVPHFEKMLYDNALLAARLPARLAGARPRALPPRLRARRWTGCCGRCAARRAASTRPSTPTPRARRVASTSGPRIRSAPCSASRAEAVIELLRGHRARQLRGRQHPPPARRPGAFPSPTGKKSPRPASTRRASALYEARAERVWPGLDDKRLTSWNALAIAALAEAGAVLGRDDYLDAARELRRVRARLRCATSDGRLLRTYKDGDARLNAYLEDHAFLLEALLTLYEASLRSALVRARPRARRHDDRPLRRPRARWLLLDLRRPRGADRPPQGDRRPPDPVRQQLRGAGPAAPRGADRRARVRAPGRGRLRPLRQTGDPAPGVLRPPAARARLLTSRRPRRWRWSATTSASWRRWSAPSFRPHLVLAGGPEGSEEPPLLRERPLVDGQPAAYVCENFACQAPVTDPEELAGLL